MYRIGDYVVRKSYGKDILFRIIYISRIGVAKLIGVSFRVLADAPLNDLEICEDTRYTKKEDLTMQKINKNIKEILLNREQQNKDEKWMFQKPGTVLHIDGDPFYLKLCMQYYTKLKIKAVGEHVVEFEQPRKIKGLIKKYNPSILIITGHDSINKNYKDINNIREYRNSKYYFESIVQARQIRPSQEQMVIFAGACQSDFEALLEAGADFAASPNRILIHALDPVFIAESIAYNSFHKVMKIEDVLRYTITGIKGLGGYETNGKCRKGGPISPVAD